MKYKLNQTKRCLRRVLCPFSFHKQFNVRGNRMDIKPMASDDTNLSTGKN